MYNVWHIFLSSRNNLLFLDFIQAAFVSLKLPGTSKITCFCWVFCSSWSSSQVILTSTSLFGLVGEVVEDLLKCCLDDWVLTDCKLLLDVFHHTEEEANRILVSAYLQFPAGTEMFDDFQLFKLLFQMVNGSISFLLSELPSHELSCIYFLTIYKLVIEGGTQACLRDFLS